MILTILNPAAEIRKQLRLREIRLSDYIAVYHLDVCGTWEMADCMSAENRAKLARWANEEERKAVNERSRRRHAGIRA